ncbi:MAG: hypothetical protein HS108_13180 [Planctomycetes bacterium]|jgi:hypothetical protein|nr:hypothetical protein [Planctomycetota bacterium]MCL4731219.1 hypothetical protein [Planctomycetota bacterium]
MGEDPNFRLKAFAVIACVLGVFLVSYVAQRVYYWARTRRREDVETTRVAPIVDFGLLALGAFVIWLAIEALLIAIAASALKSQPEQPRKIAEIEIGKLDRETNQTNLLFYPVDNAGRRQPEQRRPVLTGGDHFHLTVEVLQWRAAWDWLGEGGYYQFIALGGTDRNGAPVAERTSLQTATLPQGLGRMVFLKAPAVWEIRQACNEGEIYDIVLDPQTQSLVVTAHR